MKYILLFIFMCSAAICNAQTQRIKDLLREGGDINASHYTKAQEVRNRQSIILENADEKMLLHLNGKLHILKGAASVLYLVEPNKIKCMEIVTDEKKIADYTKDASIKKLIIIETKE
ncbi:MAG: hypothetical protein K2Q24_03375 [Chitinophagaceae bacterium]|jgi:hypothetical protein|nr:hypothetical protein [Chitinophagaceae bacterium]